MDRIIFHIDVNSAYLSWEAAYRIGKGDTEDLRSIPSVVGGDREKRHGVVLAKSEKCKAFGIVTGEPIVSALRKCPQLTVVPPRFGIYEKYSSSLTELVKEYSDTVQKYSIDELFLDYTYMKSHFGDEIKTADKIRRRVRDELGFTVCVGIGSNKLLAKMATELRKPDFTNTLFDYELEKLWALPVGELFMVGRKTAEKLNVLGIKTIGQLAKADVKMLNIHFKSYGQMIWEYANGHDDSQVEAGHQPPKSISSALTLPKDLCTPEEADAVMLGICERICSDLRSRKLYTENVGVQLRTASFKDFGHSRKVAATNGTTEVYNHAQSLLRELWKKSGPTRGEPIRLVGVKLAGLTNRAEMQLSLFDAENAASDRKKAADAAIDGIRDRYGFNAVKRASLIEQKPAGLTTDADGIE